MDPYKEELLREDLCSGTTKARVLAAAKSFGNAIIPTTEATALRDSLVKAKDQGFSNIQVEGDSKLVIDVINGRISTLWRLLKIIQDIRMIAMSFTSISFKHIFREAKFVTDAIAHECHLLPNGCTWMGSCPFAATRALLFDDVNSGCPR
ncbi:hypothetical protein ACLB2K_003390 [Fragaria x ananassa]